jgi:hypothetical protein
VERTRRSAAFEIDFDFDFASGEQRPPHSVVERRPSAAITPFAFNIG